MAITPSHSLSVANRRYGRAMAYRNGAIWALGNGMASSTLVIYFALEFGVEWAGMATSMILAAPRIAGLLRSFAPMLIDWWGDRKRFCLTAYLLSTLVLALLPLSVAVRSPAVGLAVLVTVWCVYHLLEYLATVALLSWFGDLVPLRIRGRFFGRRERWMVFGQTVGMVVAGLFTGFVGYTWPDMPKWLIYTIPAELGAIYMAISLVPLGRMPDPARAMAAAGRRARAMWGSLTAPLADKRFRRLIYFGCWFSFFNGVTQSAQFIYPARVLGISLMLTLALRMGMRMGQLGISPTMGRLADRLGNRPVMLVVLPIVASGPLFFFLATPERWYWVIGAWVVWIAYSGLNVCLPNLMLKLSPREDKTAYIASYFAITGLCIAASTLAGGAIHDRLFDAQFVLGSWQFDFYEYNFLVGWITRTMGIILLWRVIEPK